MTHDVQAIRDDLAFVRALAQEGRRAPLLNGAPLLWAGVIYAAASIAAWALAAQVIAAPPWWQLVVWLVASAVFTPVLMVAIRAGKAKPGATALTNRAVSIAWTAVGWAILTLFLAAEGVSWRTHSPVVWSLFPSLVLAIYGAGWLLAGVMSGTKWIVRVAIGCFVAAVGISLLVDRPEVFLVYALALLLLAALPGWLLMRGEPAELV